MLHMNLREIKFFIKEISPPKEYIREHKADYKEEKYK